MFRSAAPARRGQNKSLGSNKVPILKLPHEPGPVLEDAPAREEVVRRKKTTSGREEARADGHLPNTEAFRSGPPPPLLPTDDEDEEVALNAADSSEQSSDLASIAPGEDGSLYYQRLLRVRASVRQINSVARCMLFDSLRKFDREKADGAGRGGTPVVTMRDAGQTTGRDAGEETNKEISMALDEQGHASETSGLITATKKSEEVNLCSPNRTKNNSKETKMQGEKKPKARRPPFLLMFYYLLPWLAFIAAFAYSASGLLVLVFWGRVQALIWYFPCVVYLCAELISRVHCAMQCHAEVCARPPVADVYTARETKNGGFAKGTAHFVVLPFSAGWRGNVEEAFEDDEPEDFLYSTEDTLNSLLRQECDVRKKFDDACGNPDTLDTQESFFARFNAKHVIIVLDVSSKSCFPHKRQRAEQLALK